MASSHSNHHKLTRPHVHTPQACTALEVSLAVRPTPSDPVGYDTPTLLALPVLSSLRLWAAGDEGGRLDCRKLQVGAKGGTI